MVRPRDLLGSFPRRGMGKSVPSALGVVERRLEPITVIGRQACHMVRGEGLGRNS